MQRQSYARAHMVVGIGVLTFRLHDCRSLKAKRSIVKAIINKIRNHFNASVADVGLNDIYQRAQIGFALVGNDHSYINARIDHILNFVEQLGLAELIDSEMEIIHM